MPVLNKQNANRFRKVYPGVRKTPVYGLARKIEAVVLELTNTNTATYVFKNGYANAPAVTACVLNEAGDANTNVVISSITSSSVTIETSVNITGKVHLQVVEV